MTKGIGLAGGSAGRSLIAVSAGLLTVAVLVAVGNSQRSQNLVAGAVAPAAGPPSQGKPLASAPAGLQAAASSALGAEKPSFLVRQRGGSLVSAGGGLSTVFGRSGPVVQVGSADLGLSFAGVGYGARLSHASRAIPLAAGNKVSYRRSGLTEWYRNGPLGLEQGFTLQDRPARGGPGWLTVAVRASGTLQLAQHGHQVVFTGSSGARVLARYGGLSAVDAAGQSLTARIRLEDGTLLLEVDDAGARYPLTIDPFLQVGSELTASGDEPLAAEFGFSVALSSDGTTALIGGPEVNGGFVWVFTQSGGVWTQQGPKLTGGGETGSGLFGWSLALSADGNTALIGGMSDNSGVGAAWVFTRSGGVWTQEGSKLTGGGEVGAGRFGTSVALSADGETGLVSGNGAAWVFTDSGGTWSQQGPSLPVSGQSVALSSDGNTALIGSTGTSWVYTRSAGVWTQQQQLIGSGPVPGTISSVALSADGSIALIGASSESSGVGVAWVFTQSGGVWTQEGPALTAGDETGAGRFGQSVALSAAGSTALVGGGADNNDIGAAWVFAQSGGLWTQQGPKLTSGETVSGSSLGAQFGASVALSADGSTALVGAPNDEQEAFSKIGAAWVFTQSGGVWTRQSPALTGGSEIGAAEFGYSVALSSDGTTALIGGPDDISPFDDGAAWVFTQSGGVWTQQGPKLIPSSTENSGEFGFSVALSADGNTALIGNPQYNGGVGAAWVFTRSGGAWTQQGPMLAGGGEAGHANFGWSVALSSDGGTALVGGLGDGTNQVGAAWVFTQSGGVWTQQGSKLTGAGAVGSAIFGSSVALSADGNTALIGGRQDNGTVGGQVGAAWVFARSGGVWTQVGSKLTASDETGPGDFGWSVALSADGSTALIGGPSDNGDAGAAWVFAQSAGLWTQQGSKLTGSGETGVGGLGNGFGKSVALSADGNTALIGDSGDNSNVGAAFVFTRSAGVWTQQGAKVTASDETGAGLFGFSVALSGGTALIGGDGDNGSIGAAWVFASPPVVTVPSDLVVEATGPGGAAVSFSASATDVSDGAIAPTCDPSSGSIFPLGTTTVSCSATDSEGLTGSASFTVTVQDTTPPTLHLANVVVPATSLSGALVGYSATATDLVDVTDPVSCLPVSGAAFPIGVTTVSCSATDAHGNAAGGSFTVTVTDAPTLHLPAGIVVEATGPLGARVTFAATATDPVDGADPVTCSRRSGSRFPLGVTTVDCSATDAHGTTTSGSFTVTVQDTTPPVLHLPHDRVVEARGPGGRTVTFHAHATDIVDGSVPVTCVPPSGSAFPVGTTTVECSATDAHGNSATGSFTITVRDTIPPTLHLPAHVIVEATGPSGALVDFTATATDLVDGTDSVTCVPPSGSTFPLGTTVVACSATDAAGNNASGTFRVTVRDTTPPALTLPADKTVGATGRAGATVTFTATASDLVDGTVAVHCSPASGATFHVGTTTVNCSATDEQGNRATGSFTVTVTPH